MKKATTVLCCLLFALLSLFPAGVLIFAGFGYTFELISFHAFAIIIAILSVCAVVFRLKTKDAIKNKAICALLAVITLLSLVNAAFYIYKCSTAVVVISVFVSVGCSFFITMTCGKPVALKITSLALSALVTLPIISFGLITLFFGNLAQNTVVQTVKSPSGKYYAEVVDSDQGALGGDTHVNVYYEESRIDFIVFKVEKKPQSVYFGDWGEAYDMEVYWKGEQCLVINSVEYEIE